MLDNINAIFPCQVVNFPILCCMFICYIVYIGWPVGKLQCMPLEEFSFRCNFVWHYFFWVLMIFFSVCLKFNFKLNYCHEFRQLGINCYLLGVECLCRVGGKYALFASQSSLIYWVLTTQNTKGATTLTNMG